MDDCQTQAAPTEEGERLLNFKIATFERLAAVEKGKNADADVLEKEQAEREEKAKKEREAKKVKPASLDEGDKAIIQAVNNAKDVVSHPPPLLEIA